MILGEMTHTDKRMNPMNDNNNNKNNIFFYPVLVFKVLRLSLKPG